MSEKNEKAKKLYELSGLPPVLRGWSFEKARSNKAANQILDMDWTELQPFVILQGTNNTGKSVMLSCVIMMAARAGIAARYVDELEHAQAAKRTWSTREPPPPFTVPPYSRPVPSLLCWDELGYHEYRDETAMFDLFGAAIDQALSWKVNVIFATNYSITKLRERVGKRFWARLERRTPVVFELKEKMV